jgi:hypothetical protein
MCFLDIAKSRYTTKKYDPNGKIADETIRTVEGDPAIKSLLYKQPALEIHFYFGGENEERVVEGVLS